MNVLYLNGKIAKNAEGASFYNPSFLYGINCFEGIRAYWNGRRQEMFILDLDAHLDRLYASMAQLSFSPPVMRVDLKREIHSILENESVREDVYIRITAFLGGDTSWREPGVIHYMIGVRSYPSTLGRHKPIRLGISTVRRITAESMPPQVKAGANYLNSRYALMDAKRRGYDDALFLTGDGVVSESTGSAVFFIADGQVETPSIDCDILESITRRRIIALCGELGISVRETRIDPDELGGYEAVFLAGTAVEIRPVESIDDHQYATDHSLAVRIVEAMSKFVSGESSD